MFPICAKVEKRTRHTRESLSDPFLLHGPLCKGVEKIKLTPEMCSNDPSSASLDHDPKTEYWNIEHPKRVDE